MANEELRAGGLMRTSDCENATPGRMRKGRRHIIHAKAVYSLIQAIPIYLDRVVLGVWQTHEQSQALQAVVRIVVNHNHCIDLKAYLINV